MKTVTLPTQPDAKSPAGADIRFLISGETGNMIHSTVPPHQINKATVHATVHEFWYVLEGHGEIWRDNGLESRVTALVPGTSLDVPVDVTMLRFEKNARYSYRDCFLLVIEAKRELTCPGS